MKLKRGFTLIELMIVVAIIAIIAIIIGINYAHARNNAKVAATVTNMTNIATALELYYQDHGQYPPGGGVDVDLSLFGGPGNKYLTSIPSSPGTHQPYYYVQGTNPAGFTITDVDTYDSGSVSQFPNYNSNHYQTCATYCSGHLFYLNFNHTTGIYAV